MVFLSRKMGKFCLQMSKMAVFLSKNDFPFVNFLKRRFVWRVNFGWCWGAWENFFEIVFLDIREVLCYYIMYILGKLCPKSPDWWSFVWPDVTSAFCGAALCTCACVQRNPTAKVICEHPDGANEHNQRAKKLLILAGGNAHEKQNFHKTALLGFGTDVSCEQRRNRC